MMYCNGRIQSEMFAPETVWEFSMVDRIKFGQGASKELSDELPNSGSPNIMIVTDQGIQSAGIIEYITQHIPDEVGVTIFSDVEPDPTISAFNKALNVKTEVIPDYVIGVGGGSSMDVAKTIGAVDGHNNDILDYVAKPTGEGKSIQGSSTPTIAIPTTAGTGSETSPVAVVSLPKQELKVGISDSSLYPDLALIDPTLSITLPPEQTAASGMDALTHAIEAYTTRRFDMKVKAHSSSNRPNYDGRTVMTDLYARKSINLIGNNLKRAYVNGKDIKARKNMALGSLFAGLAFTNAGLGAVHAIAYPLASKLNLPHGLAVAALLPSVIRFNAIGNEHRFEEVARLLGNKKRPINHNEAGEVAATCIEDLTEQMSIIDAINSHQLTESEISELSNEATKIQRLLECNPRGINKTNIEKIIHNSIQY